MNTQVDQWGRPTGTKAASRTVPKGIAARIKRWLSKYVTVDHEAIFKDPNWPHLWEHKK